MNDCGFCGGPRTNGRPLERDPDGGWRENTGSLNPARPDFKFSCRSCAEERL